MVEHLRHRSNSSSFFTPSDCESSDPHATHATRSIFSARESISRIRCPANSNVSGACISINESVEPQLEHQQRPQLMRIITLAARVQFNELSYRVRFEQASSQRFIRKHHLTKERLHL